VSVWATTDTSKTCAVRPFLGRKDGRAWPTAALSARGVSRRYSATSANLHPNHRAWHTVGKGCGSAHVLGSAVRPFHPGCNWCRWVDGLSGLSGKRANVPDTGNCQDPPAFLGCFFVVPPPKSSLFPTPTPPSFFFINLGRPSPSTSPSPSLFPASLFAFLTTVTPLKIK